MTELEQALDGCEPCVLEVAAFAGEAWDRMMAIFLRHTPAQHERYYVQWADLPVTRQLLYVSRLCEFNVSVADLVRRPVTP